VSIHLTGQNAPCTWRSSASRIAKTFMRNPIFMDLTTKTARTPSTVAHVAMAVRGNNDRATVVANLMQVHPSAQAMIFTNTRVRAAHLAEVLGDRGIPAVPMHSDLSQSLRELYLDRFRAGALQHQDAAEASHLPPADLIEIAMTDCRRRRQGSRNRGNRRCGTRHRHPRVRTGHPRRPADEQLRVLPPPRGAHRARGPQWYDCV